MNCITIEMKNGKTYIKCVKCGTILASNDNSLSLAPIRKYQIKAISSCKHFQVSEINGTIEIIPRES